MKRNTPARRLVPLSFLAGLLLSGAVGTASLRAQSYSMSWSKIAAGQATSTNGQFSVTGTVGQADATAPLLGGSYAVTGGFWSFISVVQTPGSPELDIALRGPQTVLISWPAPSTGFVLQQTSALGTAAWVDVTNSVTSTPLVNQVEVTFIQGNTFYRLIQR
jgi:hypothetical protein